MITKIGTKRMKGSCFCVCLFFLIGFDRFETKESARYTYKIRKGKRSTGQDESSRFSEGRFSWSGWIGSKKERRWSQARLRIGIGSVLIEG